MILSSEADQSRRQVSDENLAGILVVIVLLGIAVTWLQQSYQVKVVNASQ